MTSVFFQGKYRQRKDWSTSSIPELVSLEEESSHVLPEIPTTLPPKAPRRSSLAIGLLVGGRGTADPKSKRRSSIATAFLGRQNKVNFKSIWFISVTIFLCSQFVRSKFCLFVFSLFFIFFSHKFLFIHLFIFFFCWFVCFSSFYFDWTISCDWWPNKTKIHTLIQNAE